ncbi:MAG: metallophosphoesterase [Clostridia bacterium]|nr:metallophosphoesterase [Clostridia bacterium]MBR6634297.1 metallophosphoesterase [Clostridia bacterium]
MDITTVINYLKDLFATFMVLLTMISPFSGNDGVAYEATRPNELITSFAVVSDIHVETNQPEAYNNLYKLLEGIKAGQDVDAVIYTGDNVMNGQTLENIFFYSAVKAMRPAENNFVLAGNHDLGNSTGDYKTLLENYIRNNKLYLGEDVGKGYFCRVLNGCYIISLISEESSTWEFVMSEEQFTWLEGTLKEAQAADAPIFVFNHFPLNFTGGSGGRLAELLSEYGADLFVHGHYHDHPIYSSNFYNWGGINSINLTRPTEINLFDSGEGIVVEVYENEFIVRVRNFITGEWSEDLIYTYQF